MINVEESLCINCGACIRACPGGLITKKDFPVAIEYGWDLCIDCGHCVAICPTGAMHQRAMGPEDCEEIDIHLIPRWDRVIQLASPGLGLGTTFTSGINTASQGYPPLIETIGLPEGCIPQGPCVIGYPAEKYHRIPVRKPVNVTWG